LKDVIVFVAPECLLAIEEMLPFKPPLLLVVIYLNAAISIENRLGGDTGKAL